MGDAYRDIVFSGGQVNAGFIPLWVTLVTGLGIILPRWAGQRRTRLLPLPFCNTWKAP